MRERLVALANETGTARVMQDHRDNLVAYRGAESGWVSLSRAQWRKAMPALGVTVKEEAVRSAVQEAENSPAKLNNLLRYVFNIPTAQIDRVIPMDKWQACAGDLPSLAGRSGVLSLDVASHEDLTALSLFIPGYDGDKGYLKTWFWCPEDKIAEREKKQMAHYGQWAREGHLQSTPGGRIDAQPIIKKIRELLVSHRISELLYDPWGADEIINAIQFEVECVAIQQGPVGMAGFCKVFLDAVIEQKIVHDDNPVMNWCCSNTSAETKPDVVWFSKKKSHEKIDGAITGAMAVGRGMTKPQDTGPQLILI